MPGTPHNRPMMKCGHAANGTRRTDVTNPDGTTHPNPYLEPCCVICAPSKEAYEIEENPIDLRTREARCELCGARRPSSLDLPFFVYYGPMSPHDLDHPTSHVPPSSRTKGGRPFDEFYCGCRGWD